MAEYIKREDIKYELWSVGPLCEPLMVVRKKTVDSIPAADVAPVVHGPMRIEVTTDDFVNRELAANGGWYRKHYFCPSCGQKLKEEIYEKEHCFAGWDLVREECPLNYCPNCGARMDGDGNG